MYKKRNIIRNKKGLTLLEVLLVVGLMTVLITGAANIFDDWFRKSVNRKVATQMIELQDAAEQYVTLNLELVQTTLVPNEDDVAELDINDLIDRDFLPNDYRARIAFGQSLRVLLRNAGANTVEGTAIEVITVTDDLGGVDSRMADFRLHDAALAGGPKIGLISAADLGSFCCDGNIQSAYGEWSVSLNDFSSVYNRTPDPVLGGYMAAYGRVSLEDTLIDDRYLYRVEVTSRPELNRMMTNIDMNENDLVNAGAIISDNMQVDGNATLLGQESGLASPYVLSVQDHFEGNQSFTVTAGGNNKGDLIIQGDTDAGTYDLNVAGDVSLPSASGRIVTSTATVNSVQNMGSGVFEELNVRSGSFAANRIIAVNTQITGDVQQTTFLQTSSTDVNSITASNAVTAITTVNSATTNIAGDLDSNNNIAVQGTTNVPRMLGTENVTMQTLQSCANGCPP